MKKAFDWFFGTLAVVIGCGIGGWVWEKVLEPKMDTLKDRLSSKQEES